MAALLLWGCDQSATSANSGGTNDETSTFYLQNGKTASFAAVTVYAAGSTDTLPQTKTYADAHGNVIIPKLAKGYYSLVVRDSSGQAVFLDSVFSDGVKTIVPSDTLRSTGVLVGRTKVQPQDDPKIAWVALPGAGIFANVDDSGRFRLSGIPEGRYNLLARTDIPQYTSTFRQVTVKRDSTTNAGTIEIVFTGLPVVTGIVGTWDSLAGTIALHWNKIASTTVTGYRVYRGTSSDPNGEVYLGFVDSTRSNWIDSMFDGSNAIAADTTFVRYRVVVLSQGDVEGPRWNSWSDTVRRPALVAQLSAAWTRISSSLPSLGSPGQPARLDTLPGNLLLVGRSTDGTTSLSISPNGASWNLLRAEIDTGSWPAGGLSRGVVYQDKFWWVRSRPSGRSFSPGYNYMARLADSLVIVSIDATGRIDSASIAASSDSTSSFDLITDSAGLVLLEGMVRYDIATSATPSQVLMRRLRINSGDWQEGAWASWYPDFPSRNSPDWWNYLYSSRIVSPQGRTTILQGYGYVTGSVLDLDVRLLTAAGSLYYSASPNPVQWHLVQGSPQGLQTLALFQGSIWTTDGASLWKVSLP
jgi:hypothetical protein